MADHPHGHREPRGPRGTHFSQNVHFPFNPGKKIWWPFLVVDLIYKNWKSCVPLTTNLSDFHFLHNSGHLSQNRASRKCTPLTPSIRPWSPHWQRMVSILILRLSLQGEQTHSFKTSFCSDWDSNPQTLGWQSGTWISIKLILIN